MSRAAGRWTYGGTGYTKLQDTNEADQFYSDSSRSMKSFYSGNAAEEAAPLMAAATAVGNRRRRTAVKCFGASAVFAISAVAGVKTMLSASSTMITTAVGGARGGAVRAHQSEYKTPGNTNLALFEVKHKAEYSWQID